jgi:hypothetical protein
MLRVNRQKLRRTYFRSMGNYVLQVLPEVGAGADSKVAIRHTLQSLDGREKLHNKRFNRSCGPRGL